MSDAIELPHFVSAKLRRINQPFIKDYAQTQSQYQAGSLNQFPALSDFQQMPRPQFRSMYESSDEFNVYL